MVSKYIIGNRIISDIFGSSVFTNQNDMLNSISNFVSTGNLPNFIKDFPQLFDGTLRNWNKNNANYVKAQIRKGYGQALSYTQNPYKKRAELIKDAYLGISIIKTEFQLFPDINYTLKTKGYKSKYILFNKIIKNIGFEPIPKRVKLYNQFNSVDCILIEMKFGYQPTDFTSIVKDFRHFLKVINVSHVLRSKRIMQIFFEVENSGNFYVKSTKRVQENQIILALQNLEKILSYSATYTIEEILIQDPDYDIEYIEEIANFDIFRLKKVIISYYNVKHITKTQNYSIVKL